MKLRYTPMLFVLLLLTLHIHSTTEFWWAVTLEMSVTGNYHFNENNIIHEGNYSFDIHLTGALEQDISNDYILYAGDPEVTVLDWNESTPNTQKKKFKPHMKLNYVLNENGKIYFDLEVLLKTPLPETPHPFHGFLLPRSALNKGINKKDKYNKNVIKGSNKIKIPEKSILKNNETIKTFAWSWRRDKTGLMNSHSVELTIKIVRKTRDR